MTNDKHTSTEPPNPQEHPEDPSETDTATRPAASDAGFPTWPSQTMRVDDLRAFAALSIPPQLREIFGDAVMDRKLKVLEESELLLVLREETEMAFVRFTLVALEEKRPGSPTTGISESAAQPPTPADKA